MNHLLTFSFSQYDRPTMGHLSPTSQRGALVLKGLIHKLTLINFVKLYWNMTLKVESLKRTKNNNFLKQMLIDIVLRIRVFQSIWNRIINF